MERPPTQPFATIRQAERHAEQLAMERPVSARMATASGRHVKDFTEKVTAEAWQAEAYEHVNAIGELGYVLGVQANTVAKGRLVLVEEDENGVAIDPKDSDTPSANRAKAERVHRALTGPDGGEEAILERLAWHDPIAGEALLLGEPVGDDKGKVAKNNAPLAWEVVSVLEIVEDEHSKGQQGGARKLKRKRSAASARLDIRGQQNAEAPLHDQAYLARYHRKDLAYSGDPTSALRRNAGICREIILLDQLKAAMIKSKIPAGILFVPEEVDFPAEDDDGIADGDDISRFLQTLVRHMSTAVEDRSSATALVPNLVRAPADMIEKFKLLSLSDGTLDLTAVKEARDDALSRLAAGVDVPPERMTGMGATNHWTSALLSDDEIQKHVIPTGERLAGFLTISYLRRKLIAAEEMSPEDAERFRFEYTAPETRMDKAASADTLYDDNLLSGRKRVETHGFDPDLDMPSEDELARRYIEKLVLTPSVTNRALLAALIKLDEVEGLDSEMIEAFLKPPTATTPEPAVEEDDPDPAVDGPPVETDEVIGGGDIPATGEPGIDQLAILERLRTAAAGTVDRALEKAANQVITQSKRLPSATKDQLDQPALRTTRRKPEVLRILTADDWRTIKRTPEALLRDAFGEFEPVAADWLRTHYETSMEPTAADEAARRAASQLCTELDALALSAFRRPLPREHGLTVPMQLVAGCVEQPARR